MTRKQMKAKIASMRAKRIPVSEVTRVINAMGARSSKTGGPLTISGVYSVITSMRNEAVRAAPRKAASKKKAAPKKKLGKKVSKKTKAPRA